jgi:hypothetical protein
MIRTLIIELRRSPMRWWLPVLIAVDLAVLLLRPLTWIGVWPQASAAAQLPTFYFGLALAPAAAWSAGRTARAEADELLLQMPRPAWQREAVHLVAVWLYGLLAYLVGILVAAGVSLGRAGPGFLWPSYLLLGLSMITLCAGIGHLAGRLFRSRFVAPLVAVPVVFLNVALRLGPDHVFYVLSGAVQLGLSAWAVATRLAVAVAVAALAVTVIPLAERNDARRTPRRYVPSATAFAATVAAVVALASGGALRHTRPAPADPLCSAGTPRVCVWPDDRKYLPIASAMAHRLAELPPGLVDVPTTFYELGLRPEAESNTDFNTIFDTWSIAQNMALTVSAATMPTTNCSVAEADQEQYFAAVFEFDQWLSERAFGGPQPSYIHGGPPGIDEATIHHLTTEPESRQTDWIRQRLDRMRSLCG